MSPRTTRYLVTLLLGLMLVLGSALPGWAAASDLDENADDATEEGDPVSLRLSPAVLEIPNEPGPARHTLRVENTGTQPLPLITETDEFTVTPEGQTRFAGPDEVGAASWVEVETDAFELAPGQGRDVEVTVEVPDDAEPGERYVSVIFAVPGSEEGGNIVVTHRVAAKFYIEVPGEQIHHIDLGELAGPRLVDSTSATFELEVDNLGNVHRRFEEPHQLVATSGDAEFPFQNFTILGDSTRVVEAVWPDPPTVCWCAVEVTADDGQGNLLTASTRVLVFPLRLTLGLLVLTAGLLMLAASRRRRRTAKLDARLAAAHAAGAATAGLAQPSSPEPAPAWQASWQGATPASVPHDRNGHGPEPEADPGPRQPAAPASSRVEPPSPVTSAPATVGSQFGTPMFTAHGPPRRRRTSR